MDGLELQMFMQYYAVVLGSSPPLSSPSRDQVRNLLSPSPSSSPKGAELDSSPSP